GRPHRRQDGGPEGWRERGPGFEDVDQVGIKPPAASGDPARPPAQRRRAGPRGTRGSDRRGSTVTLLGARAGRGARPAGGWGRVLVVPTRRPLSGTLSRSWSRRPDAPPEELFWFEATAARRTRMDPTTNRPGGPPSSSKALAALAVVVAVVPLLVP